MIAPAAALQERPLEGAVALYGLKEALGARGGDGRVEVPQGAARLAVVIDGSESEEELAQLSVCVCVWGGEGRVCCMWCAGYA